MAVIVGTTPGDVDLVVTRGDRGGTFQFTPQTALDLSGYTWLAQVRATRDEPDDVTATFTVDDSDAATGVIRITLPASEARALVTVDGKGTFYWDLQATSDSDAEDVKTWFRGKLKVGFDVSVTA